MSKPPDDPNQTHLVDDDTIITGDDTVIYVDDTVMDFEGDQTVLPESHEFVEDDSVVDDNTVIQGVLDDSVVSQETTITAEDTVISVADQTQAAFSDALIEPEEASQPSTPSESRRPPSNLSLRSINGTRYSLDQPLILGRLPQAPRRSTTPVNLVVLPSRDGLLSSTHARVEAMGEVVVVTDLHSTNGTRVIIPGRPELLLAPGDSFSLGEGAIIDLGDGNRLEVIR